MLQVKPAVIRVYWEYPTLAPYEEISVQYNPTELTFDKAVQIGEVGIPGLDSPLLQFVRGQNEKLTLDLFCDTTEDGMGDDAVSVATKTDQIYQLVKVRSKEHAPPVCEFFWGAGFPGSAISEKVGGSQQRTSFPCIVESVKQRFTVFSTQGVPLRATVSVTLREFRPFGVQFFGQNPQSPDRTRAHVLQSGESLSSVAARHYLNASQWRTVANVNRIEDPRRITPGAVLTLPKVDGRTTR